jgi:hypothetical protein
MFKLHIVQAEFGDSLLLEYGTAAARRFLLIDGGPQTIYDNHLKAVLKDVVDTGVLDLVVLSHVDTDHIIGLLDYFAELRTQNGSGSLPAVKGLWHNSFSRTIDPAGDIRTRLQGLITNERSAIMANAGMAINGISDGNSLRLAAQALQIPINDGFTDDLILVDTATNPVKLGILSLRIVGPTQANLDALQAQWEAWLATHEDAIESGDPFVMANSDRSVPNLSSVMFLATANGKTILFTGDGRSDHLLEGLDQAGLLNNGQLHVDVLKLPHHGSSRNITKKFFKAITADTYVASANGKDDNPDLATLIWLVEAARDQQRKVKIVVTNRTPSVEKLLEEYDPTEFGYKLEVLKSGLHRKTLTLA